MSRPMADAPKRRHRRPFTDEFKAGVVRLVLDDGKTVGAVAREIDLTETAVREWVKRARADRTHGRTGLTGRARGARAPAQRESRAADGARHLKKPRPSSRSTGSKVCLDCRGEGRLQRRRLLPRVAG